MLFSSVLQTYSSYLPTSAHPESPGGARRPSGAKPPNKPDWLIIMVSVLFLLTILIAWLVDVPVLSR
ncbi:MAG: hypothetical protein LH609_11715 [Rudanella sp.]|nr:hypothetical protein [Rudanella sp.]